MRLFNQFYKEYIPIYETSYNNVSFKINNNQFIHYFLVKRESHKVTLSFLANKNEEIKSVSKWIYDNPFMFSKFFSNKMLLYNFIKSHKLFSNPNEIGYSADCCNQSLCEHVLYSFYTLDNLFLLTPGIIFDLYGINIDTIFEKLAESLTEKIIKNDSDRIIHDENKILEEIKNKGID